MKSTNCPQNHLMFMKRDWIWISAGGRFVPLQKALIPLCQ